MEIRPIRTDNDHRAALAEIDACWGAAEGTEEGDRLDAWSNPPGKLDVTSPAVR
jgi:antitoxin component HigA of HigAB toxin-antitoxin module